MLRVSPVHHVFHLSQQQMIITLISGSKNSALLNENWFQLCSLDASMSGNQKEEPNDWPQALLTIGTLGNNDLKEESQRVEYSQDLDSSQDLSDFTIEEVNKLQKELKKLLTRKSKLKSSGSEIGEEDRANLPLNRFLNCPSSLEVDRTANTKYECSENENNGDLSPNTKIILSKLRDALSGNRNAIKKKSITFLLKKVFVCGGGFAPAPSSRDPVPESRMEKVWIQALQTNQNFRNWWWNFCRASQCCITDLEGNSCQEDVPNKLCSSFIKEILGEQTSWENKGRRRGR